MSKPMVEKYEQMLEQDPTSTVFVELARAYLERGDTERAIAVCQQGVSHHPNSVVGRVLWGKALINAGKAAEAMKQFDHAVKIDRENPHAYNLIGETLLRKGLYRSALPILRKAAALQPNDGRIAQWLDQTKQALAGGPAPVLYDSTTVGTQALGADATDAGEPPPSEAPPAPPAAAAEAVSPPPSDGSGGATDVFAAFVPPGGSDPDAQATVVTQAYAPPAAAPSPAAAAREDGVGSLEEPAGPTVTTALPTPVPASPSAPRAAAPPPPSAYTGDAPDPFAAVSSSAEEPDTFRGLTSTFDALTHGASAEVPHAQRASGPRPAGPSEPSVVVAEPAPPPSRPTPPPAAPGLLEDVVSAQSDLPTSELRIPGQSGGPVPAPAPRPRGSGGLLEEIPDDHLEPPSALEAPRVEFNPQATEAIAREYERELREKLEATKQKKTFWQRHGLTLGLVAGLVVVLGGLGGSFLYTRVKNKGESLDTALAKGLAAVNADTREQYGAALASLEQALTMDPGNAEALALQGYARAVLYAEHGGAAADRDAAVQAFAQPAVRAQRPELALVVDLLTADDGTRAAMRQQLLGSDVEKSAVHTQAGRLLLLDKKFDEALARLGKATELDARSTRALVALGDYYLAFQDWERAADMLSRAEALSKFHPARVIGLAEARLELGREQAEALSELEGLPQNAAVPPALQGRYALQLGRALSANGRHEEALKALTEAQPLYRQHAFEFALALGQAHRAAGQMAAAQAAYEEGLKLEPKSELAKEGLGRVLLARSREKELLERLKPEKDARKVALLRGIAYSRLGELKRARAELQGTQVGGKYPAEAAVYLALADAAEAGAPDKAIELLEKLATTSKKNRATVQVALARVYKQKGALDKARAQLEEAAKDPHDYEGNALLGELLLEAGVPHEVALEPLQRAVERNGSHGPSRHLLTRALLAQGKVPEALKQIEAWTADNPALELAWRDAAAVYLQAGRLAEAKAASAKVSPAGEDEGSLRVKALIFFALADGRTAMSALERANKMNPKDPETFCEIGHAFVRQGNADTAPAAYGAALREDPKSICGQAGPYHARPVAKGKPLPSEVLTQLVARAPTAWEKGFLLATQARVHLAGNELKAAKDAAQEAVETAPAHAAAWFATAEVAKKDGRPGDALAALEKAVTFDGSWAQARLAWADALAKQGGDALPQALAQYEAVLVIDQNETELARVKKTVAALKKQLAQ